MRIVVVGHSMHGGGAEYVTRIWIAELRKLGHHVVVVTTDRDDRDGVQGFKVDVRLGRGAASHAGKVGRLRELLSKEQYDVCLSMQTYPSLVSLLAVRSLRGIRTSLVISERNVPSILLPLEGTSGKAQLALARLLYRRASAVIAISHPVAADMVSSFHVPVERIYVVPNPASEKYDVPSAPSVGGSIAGHASITIALPFRLAPQKQPLRAVEVALELRRRGISVDLISFGSGSLQDALGAAARANDVPIAFHGWDENWIASTPARSVVLLPSYCEGFGNVLIEAASAGLASVAPSTALGVADAIAHGITGYLSLNARPAAMADAVEAASKLVVEAGPWLERFSTSNSVSLLLQCLTEVRARRGTTVNRGDN